MRLGEMRQVLRLVWHHISEHDVLALAAEGAYYFFFSLFPLVLFAVSLLGVVGDRQRTLDFLLTEAQRNLPGDAATLLRGVFQDVVLAKGAGGVLSVGAVLTLWAASNVFSGLRDALNHAVGVAETRPYWRQVLIAIAFVLGSSIFLFAATVILLDGEGLVNLIADHIGLSQTAATVWTVGQIILALMLLVLVAWALYHYLPNACFTARTALQSALIASALWLIATLGFRLYVQHLGTYNRVYGAVGAVIILLTWMYLSILALLIGGQFGAALQQLRNERRRAVNRGAPAPASPA